MDALGLMTAAPPAGTGTQNIAEGNALDSAAGTEAIDFATLLAAGLMPPPQPGVLPAPVPTPTEAPASAAAELPELARAEPASLPAASEPLSKTGKRDNDTRATVPLPETELSASASLHALRELPAGAHAATLAASAGSGADALAATLIGHHAQTTRQADLLEPQLPLDALAAAPHPLIHALAERAGETRPVAMLEVGARVDTPQFASALSQQVVWMADKDAQVAELRINPPELGPVEVRLQIKGDEAAVQFVSAHADVRDALESSLVRLRESLAQAGIQLGNASVGADSFREQERSSNGRDADAQLPPRPGETSWTLAQPASRQVGLVDLFA